MKTLKSKMSIFALIILSVFTITSCDKFMNPVGNDDNGNGNYPPMDDYILVHYDANEIMMTDATLDQFINITSIYQTCGLNDEFSQSNMNKYKGEKGNKGNKGNKGYKDDKGQKGKKNNNGYNNRDKNRKQLHFGYILDTLNLTEVQMDSIEVYFASHRDCVKGWLTILHDAQMDILQNAREQQKAILDSVKSGAITRIEAQRLLRTLNAETRAELQANKENEEVTAGLLDCYNEFINKIKSQLAPEQLLMFEEWLATHPFRQ